MATQEQERRSPPLETARTASDEPQLPGLVPVAGGSAVTAMAIGDMAGGGDAGEEEHGPERALDNVRSSSPPVAALLPVVNSGSSLVSFHIASPQIQRKPRSLVPRAPPANWWLFKLPVLRVPPAPAKKKTRKRSAKKRDMPCLLCKATETPLWRTWPTDRRVALCNACGIKVRTPRLMLPKLVYLSPPATATATTTVVSAELEHPVAPPPEIQPVPEAVLPAQLYVHIPPPAAATTTVVPDSELEQPPPQQEIQDSDSSPPDSPTLDSTLDLDVYLLRRTSPRRRENSPPPPPTAAAAPALGNDNDKPEKCCQHCGTTSTRQWRMGPMGEKSLCNPCGVRYRQNRLVPEYRPKASPTFNQEAHSNVHRQVLLMRKKQNHPAPPAKYKPIRTRKRRNKGKGQQQPAQVPKKRKRNQEPNQQPAAQPAEVAMLPAQPYVHLPPPAAATTTVVSNSELEQPPPQQEIQDSDSSPPDSPTLDSTLDLDIYLLRRTSPRRREESPPPPPTAAEFAPAAAAPAPGNEDDKPERSCQHCGATSTRQWRMGPMGERTLCNPCGVRYRQNRLVPEYRPKASPTFNQEEHSNLHSQVLQIRRKQNPFAKKRRKQNHPAPPAKYKPIRTRKRRNKGKGQQQPSQVPKKRKGNDDIVQGLPHTGGHMVQDLNLPPALPHAGGDDMEVEQQQLLLLPSAQPHGGGDMEEHLPPPLALPHAGGELMMDDPIPPPDAFLFDGPAAPKIIDNEPMIVIVIDDD